MYPDGRMGAAYVKRCYAVMDPHSAIPTRCSLPKDHDGNHMSRATDYMQTVLYEWTNDDLAVD